MENSEVDEVIIALGFRYTVQEKIFIYNCLKKVYVNTFYLTNRLNNIFPKKPSAVKFKNEVWKIVNERIEARKPDCKECDNKRKITVCSIEKLNYLSESEKQKIVRAFPTNNLFTSIICPYCGSKSQLQNYYDRVQSLDELDKLVIFKTWNWFNDSSMEELLQDNQYVNK
jgi:hypothetical protein